MTRALAGLALALALLALAPRPVHAADPPGDAAGYQAKVELFLKHTDPAALERVIQAWEQTGVGKWDYFTLPFFREGAFTGSETAAAPTEGQAANTAVMKKVLSKPRWAGASRQLARLRWAMLVDLWTEVAIDNNVRIELIDSGRRDAYRSDVDVTIYAPLEGRGQLTIQELIRQFEAKFRERMGYHYATLDVTVHDGSVFIPDVRNNKQSFGEFAASLAEVSNKLALKVTSGGDAYYVTSANRVEVQRRGLQQGRVTIIEPKMAPAVAGADGRPVAPRKAKPVERPIVELDPHGGKWRVSSLRFEGLTPVYDRSVGFGVVAQSLEEILRHPEDLAAIVKYFNRGMNAGAGAALVNSFMDLHGGDLPPGSLPDAAAIRTAFDLETGKVKFESKHRTKTLAKLRWLIRAFGYPGPGGGVEQRLLHLHDLLGVAADIEVANRQGRLPALPDGLGPHPLDPVVQEVKRRRPALNRAPAARVHAEAAKLLRAQLIDALGDALLATEKASLAAMSVEGFRSNSLRFMHEGGQVMAHPNVEAAKKLAFERARELAQVFQIVRNLPGGEFPLSTVGPDDFIFGLTEDRRLRSLQERTRGQLVIDVMTKPDAGHASYLPRYDDPKYAQLLEAARAQRLPFPQAEVAKHFSKDTMSAVLEAGNKVVFDLTLMLDIPSILGLEFAISDFEFGITAEELRHARSIYPRYGDRIVFVFEVDGRLVEVPPPWEMMPEEAVKKPEVLRKQWVERAIQNVIEAAPPEVRAQVRLMSEAARLELDGFLREFDVHGKTWAQALAEKVFQADKVAAGETGADVTDRELREHAQKSLRLRAGLNWELVEKLLQALDDGLMEATTVHGFVEGVRANLAPLMLGNSLVNLARAYQQGQRWGFRDALVGEAFFYLPTQYALMATALKDFGRGHFVQGTISLSTVAALHALGQQWPLAVQGFMGLSIAVGIAQIEYVYIMEAMSSDLMEHAFKSRYAGPLPRDPATGQAADGKRYFNGLRNSFPDSPASSQDTPEFPLFWDTPCPGLSTPARRVRFMDFEDGLPDWARLAKVRADYGPSILESLGTRGSSAPVSGGGVDPRQVRDRALRQAFQERVLKIAFDEPYHQRISKIYECFLPEVQRLSPPAAGGLQDRSREDDTLRAIFGPIVRDWYTRQPPVYRAQFDSVWDIVGRPAREKMLDALVAHTVRLYHLQEEIAFKAVWAREALERMSGETVKASAVQDKRLLAASRKAGKAIETNLAAALRSRMDAAEPTSVARVRLNVPTWVVGPSANAVGVSEARDELPIDVELVVGATGHDHPEPWKDDVQVKVIEVKRVDPGAAPRTLLLSDGDRRRLAEKREDGTPAHGLVLLTFEATGSVSDANGTLIGRATPASFQGYRILEIPRFAGHIDVVVSRARTPYEQNPRVAERALVPVDIEIDGPGGKRTMLALALPDGKVGRIAAFDRLPVGSYRVVARPQAGSGFGPGTATFTLADPFTKSSYEQGSPPRNPTSVDVTVPYVGVAAPPGGPSTSGDPTAGGAPGLMGPPGAIGRGGSTPGTGTTPPQAGAGQPGATQCAGVAAAGDAALARVRATLNALTSEQTASDGVEAGARSFQQQARAMLAALPAVPSQTPVDCQALSTRIAGIAQKLQALQSAWTALTTARAAAESESRAACTLAQQVKRPAPQAGMPVPAAVDPRAQQQLAQHVQASAKGAADAKTAAQTVTRLVGELRADAAPLSAPLSELTRLKTLQAQMEGMITPLESDAANAQSWGADLTQRTANARKLAGDMQTHIASEAGRLGPCLGAPEGRQRQGELAAAGQAANGVVATLGARTDALADGLAAIQQARQRLSAVASLGACRVDDGALMGLATLKGAEQGAAQLPGQAEKFATDARACLAAAAPPPPPPPAQASVKVLTVSVAPDRVKPGQAVMARAIYEIAGLSPNQFAVGDAVFVFTGPGGSQQAVNHRAFTPGANTQDQRFPTTSATQPGTYTVTASVRTATGTSNSAWTSFTVEAAPPPPPTTSTPVAGKGSPRPCTADERAAFARMTGSWKSYLMHVTIGGSCEQASGTYKVTEWCEGVEETYNASVARVTGKFTGRMEGGSLQLNQESPPSPNNKAGTKGTGSCSPNSDGTFSCRGFGCGNKFGAK